MTAQRLAVFSEDASPEASKPEKSPESGRKPVIPKNKKKRPF